MTLVSTPPRNPTPFVTLDVRADSPSAFSSYPPLGQVASDPTIQNSRLATHARPQSGRLSAPCFTIAITCVSSSSERRSYGIAFTPHPQPSKKRTLAFRNGR
jgi:hypothetical protein